MLHGISSGTIAYGNSRVERGHEDHRGTKPSSLNTWSTAWRPAVREFASFQQASGSVHDEAWAARVQSSSLRISKQSLCLTFHLLSLLLRHLDQAGKLGVEWDGHDGGKLQGRGVWWFRGALQGKSVLSALSAAGDWVKR